MTDFLTRLAQRTLGLAPVVQPRLASRYAPAAEIVIETLPEALATPESSSQPSSQLLTEAQDISLPLRYPESLSRTAPDATLNTQNNLTTNNTILIPPPLSPLSASSEVSRKDSEPLPSSSQPGISSLANSSKNSVESAALLPQQNLEVQAISPTGGLVEPQPLNPAANLPVSNLPASNLKEPSATPEPQTLPQTEQKPQSLSPYLPLVPPATASSSSQPWSNGQEPSMGSPLVTLKSPTQPASAPTPSSLARLSSLITHPVQKPEPDIEVRIGRIEVRGIQPATPKVRSRATPPTPALSLNDYLNQRDGGKP
jgi:hypothetical protein